MTPRKIHIIGAHASGKTHLARRLSRRLGIPHYALENLVWNGTGEKKRRNIPALREQLLLDIVSQDSWIVEGQDYEWLTFSFAMAEQIIFLTPSPLVRDGRMILRFIRQKIGTEVDQDRFSFGTLMNMIEWNHHFERHTKKNIIEALEPYKHKLIITKYVQ